MMKYGFLNDYSEGCHPAILEVLSATNMSQQIAYGDDDYTAHAKQCIQTHLCSPNSAIHFVSGGTMANLVIIANCLRSHEAVIAANTGHIATHETGAIEATGHKVITVQSTSGKLSATDIQTVVNKNTHAPHMAKPRLVYISNATEVGTIYTKAELTDISEVCRKNALLLMVDGARLGAALCAPMNDLTLKDLAELTDVFWIGGTKAGALLGEAIVINTPSLAEDFAFHLKQRGALLAKGRLLGLQFSTLFTDNLYFTAAQQANALAQDLSAGLIDCGHKLAEKTETNQIFAILPNTIIVALQKHFDFHVWDEIDAENSVIRLVTSWAADAKQIHVFIKHLKAETIKANACNG